MRGDSFWVDGFGSQWRVEPGYLELSPYLPPERDIIPDFVDPDLSRRGYKSVQGPTERGWGKKTTRWYAATQRRNLEYQRRVAAIRKAYRRGGVAEALALPRTLGGGDG